MAVIPLENFAASGTTTIILFLILFQKRYGLMVILDTIIVWAIFNSASICNTYDNYYDFSSYALDSSVMIDTSRFKWTSVNHLPEGQSMWWQVLNPSGVGVGLWAQISFKDSYDGASAEPLVMIKKAY